MPGNLDCSRFVEVIGKEEGADRSMGDVHPLGNPHYHFSPKNILRVAEGIAARLSELDPENAPSYRANLDGFRKRLEEKRAEWRGVPLKGKSFVAFHRLFEYLADEFGFEIIGYIEPKPGIPPSPRHLKSLVESMRRSRIDAILRAGYSGKKESEWLSTRTGVKAVQVPNDVGSAKGAGDWFAFMDVVLSSLD